MLTNNNRGFSVVEMLVVLAIISTFAVLVLPQYISARASVREDEVKSNIHTIQIALERYSVDTGGYYPPFLVGAERENNILVNFKNFGWQVQSQFPSSGMTPFSIDYGRNGEVYMYLQLFEMDPLIQYGYLESYPSNPFTQPGLGLWYSYSGNTNAAGMFPYGGRDGDKMFDLGFGWGDTPQTDFILYTTESFEESDAAMLGSDIVSDPDNDAPGNFYYHPIFADEVPAYFHCSERYYTGRGEDTPGVCIDDAVIAFHLYGYGGPGDRDSTEELGMDYFNRMPARRHLSSQANAIYSFSSLRDINTSVGGENQQRVETTGYTASEFDPWSGAWPDGSDPYDPNDSATPVSGPDGVNDWVIIEVKSGVVY